MTSFRFYQVDAFTDALFRGNPAGVCPLDTWLADDVMQQIAAENNLAETAFFVPKDEGFEIRWFTPAIEVDLCGHATLATAFVLFNQEGYRGDAIQFHSPHSGSLAVARQGDLFTLDFPADEMNEVEPSSEMDQAIGVKPMDVFKGKTDLVLVFESESEIRDAKPNLKVIDQIGGRGTIITAPGDDVDFVSRFFAPQSGIDEDPVTGSAHTTLTPYWSKRLRKTRLIAKQLSSRGGSLECALEDDRILISGKAKLYLKGEIFLA